jgi:hypothetical protein
MVMMIEPGSLTFFAMPDLSSVSGSPRPFARKAPNVVI